MGSFNPSSPLNGLTPQSTKLMKPMSTVVEEHSLQSVPECGIDDNPELFEQSVGEACVQNLEETFVDESEEELDPNNQSAVNIEEAPREVETVQGTEKRGRALETPDSIGDMQQKVSTPSMISSGYGSQALSTTPASSEDSISIQSGGMEDFRDPDFMHDIPIQGVEEQHPAQFFANNPEFLDDYHNNNNEDSSHQNIEVSVEVELLKPDSTIDTHSQGSSDGETDMKFPSWLTVGESVMISPYNKTGVVSYLGPTHFASGPWAGVELDTPTGKNDGTVGGMRYFECKPRFGIFVRPDKLVIDSRGRAMRAARAPTAPNIKKNREDISVHKSIHRTSDNQPGKARSRSRDAKVRPSSSRGKK